MNLIKYLHNIPSLTKNGSNSEPLIQYVEHSKGPKIFAKKVSLQEYPDFDQAEISDCSKYLFTQM